MGVRRGWWSGGTVDARVLLAAAVVAAVLSACGGDGAGESTAQAVDDTPVDAEPAGEEPAGEEPAGEEPADEEPAEVQAGGDEPVDLASAQAELDPWGPFDESPFDVEIPANPGEAILQIGDQRIEMATGQCRGGPVYEIMGEPIEASRAAEGVFSFIGGAGQPDGDWGALFVLTEGTSAEGFDDEVMIRQTHRLEIMVPDPEVLPTIIRHLQFLDGSAMEGMETPNTSWADTPTVRITRDGLVTAQGTVVRSASEFIDPPVEVGFAARCSQEWVDALDELEAEFR